MRAHGEGRRGSFRDGSAVVREPRSEAADQWWKIATYPSQGACARARLPLAPSRAHPRPELRLDGERPHEIERDLHVPCSVRRLQDSRDATPAATCERLRQERLVRYEHAAELAHGDPQLVQRVTVPRLRALLSGSADLREVKAGEEARRLLRTTLQQIAWELDAHGDERKHAAFQRAGHISK
jgi:hypothetical protein